VAEQRVSGLVKNPPAPNDWVEIAHPDIEGTTRVHPQSLPHWQARSWTVVEADVEAPVTAEQEAAAELDTADGQPQLDAPDPTPAPTTKRSARGAATGTEA
jgi:hypothetical protein